MHVVHQGQAGQHLFEVGGKGTAVVWAVEEAVDVVEDVFFGDGFAVLFAGAGEDEVSHPVAADVVRAGVGVEEGGVLLVLLFVVVEGEALGITIEMKVGKAIGQQDGKGLVAACARNTDEPVFGGGGGEEFGELVNHVVQIS